MLPILVESFSLPRGLRDIPPDESAASEKVRAAFVETCRLFDYKIMEPSSLELLETLEAKSGPSIRNEIYHFTDKGGRELGLRFDLTVGITRYVASRKDLALPARLASFAPLWRYEEPQFGRYRWFYQWDVEFFGPSTPEADAEVIEFSAILFKKLSTEPRISIGSRRVIESFIRSRLKIEEDSRILDALRAVDKVGKKSLDEIASEYRDSVSKQDLEAIVDFVKLKGDPARFEKTLKDYSIEDDNRLVEIFDSLKARHVRNVELDLSIVRGIDYYTDMVFEAVDSANPRLGSLCGGGRYDSLPAVYGRPELAATGVAGGVERAVIAYKLAKEPEKRVFVAPIGKDSKVVRASAVIASDLRVAGIPAQSELGERSLRKILEAQSDAKTSAVLILGERELASGEVKIKWMDSGEEETVKLEQVISSISRRL